jgi:hypothetical protein
LLAYHIAALRGLDVDQLSKLVKSVIGGVEEIIGLTAKNQA